MADLRNEKITSIKSGSIRCKVPVHPRRRRQERLWRCRSARHRGNQTRRDEPDAFIEKQRGDDTTKPGPQVSDIRGYAAGNPAGASPTAFVATRSTSGPMPLKGNIPSLLPLDRRTPNGAQTPSGIWRDHVFRGPFETASEPLGIVSPQEALIVSQNTTGSGHHACRSPAPPDDHGKFSMNKRRPRRQGQAEGHRDWRN